MKKFLKNYATGFLAAVILVSACGVVPIFAADKKKYESITKDISADTVFHKKEQAPLYKNETVYVIAKPDGSVEKVIVSDHIENFSGKEQIEDKSDLADIRNVKGNEKLTAAADGTKIWDAAGHDVYYQGTTKKELPVTMKISYTLDGTPISPADLAGKSGHVQIRVDYYNNQYQNVIIDGQEEKIYVPFLMLSGTVLDVDRFSNVKVSTGKVLSDGDRIAVIGLALPGMQANLDVEKDQLDIPDFFEIDADVVDFSMETMVTLAVHGIADEMDVEIPDVSESMDALKDAVKEAIGSLTDGVDQLYQGLCTLLEKSGELTEGIDRLAEGAAKLRDGTDTLKDGTKSLQSGAIELYEGLQTLSANSGNLNAGAKQVFDTLLATATAEIKKAGLDIPDLTVSNYKAVLNGVIASLDSDAVYQTALGEVTAQVEKQRDFIASQVEAAVEAEVKERVAGEVKRQVTAGVTETVRANVKETVISTATGGTMNSSSYDAAVAAGAVDMHTQETVNAAIEEQMQSERICRLVQTETDKKMNTSEIREIIQTNTASQMKTDAVQNMIVSNTDIQVEKAIADAMQSPTVQEKIQGAAAGLTTITNLLQSLESYQTFYNGVLTYTRGVDDAAAGADILSNGAIALKDGADTLAEGMNALCDGIFTVQDGLPAMMDGIGKLCDGAGKLSEGVEMFSEEAVEEWMDGLGDKLNAVITRLQAIWDVSESYDNFSGMHEGMDGNVKFIYRTHAVKASK